MLVILRENQIELPEKKIDTFSEQKNRFYKKSLSCLSKRDLVPGILPFLKSLTSRDFKLAVCSSSQNAKRVLKILKLESFFNATITSKEVSRAKPDPQIFLLAASRLNVKPKDCLVFEDAVSGVQAAIKAGMSVIGIGTPKNLKGPLLRIKDFSNQNQRKIEQVIGTSFN